ncbi:MAG TPA: hypothetical protein VMH90_03675 [Thermoplasmata archaeon]|nr:hypothetical protein [Thermoplasmata archaeon]
MPREMLSGPDLGAGYLFQLSIDRNGEESAFAYHAQDGGLDGGDAPAGPLGPLGWTRAPGMCMFGGRLCWHREFELPEREATRIRTPYNRTRFVLGALLDQEFRGAAVPWSEGLAEFLDRTVEPLGRTGPWRFFGESALSLHGIGIPCRTLELRVPDAAVPEIARRLTDYLIEPAARTTWNGTPVLAARAFVGTMKSGVRVGWAAPLVPAPGLASLAGPALDPETVRWNDRALPVAPIEVALLDVARTGAEATLAAACRSIPPDRFDRARLREVLRSPDWPPRGLEIVRSALADRDPSLVEA